MKVEICDICGREGHVNHVSFVHNVFTGNYGSLARNVADALGDIDFCLECETTFNRILSARMADAVKIAVAALRAERSGVNKPVEQ